jgi:hypothetical protein
MSNQQILLSNILFYGDLNQNPPKLAFLVCDSGWCPREDIAHSAFSGALLRSDMLEVNFCACLRSTEPQRFKLALASRPNKKVVKKKVSLFGALERIRLNCSRNFSFARPSMENSNSHWLFSPIGSNPR